MKFIQIQTTIDSQKKAQKIAKVMVEEKLAGCVQIVGPIESIYQWKGKIEKAKEYLLLIKTKETLYKKVEARIKILHTYETPEIIAVPIVRGSKGYLEWLKASTN